MVIDGFASESPGSNTSLNKKWISNWFLDFIFTNLCLGVSSEGKGGKHWKQEWPVALKWKTPNFTIRTTSSITAVPQPPIFSKNYQLVPPSLAPLILHHLCNTQAVQTVFDQKMLPEEEDLGGS